MDRKTLYVDIDDTLLIHNKSEYPVEMHIVVPHNGRVFVGVPHHKNILMMEKFYNLGYDIIVWSKTGAMYAQAVIEKLKISHPIKAVLSKPDFYLDDKGVEEWMGPRVYRAIE